MMEEPQSAGRVAVIGLGSMGFGIASSLLRAGFYVTGYDPATAARAQFQLAGGVLCKGPREAAEGVSVVVCAVFDAAQTEAVLFGDAGVAAALVKDGVFVSCATMAPNAARDLADRLEAQGRHYLDAPISGGAVRALEGTLTVMASGSETGLLRARPIIEAMAGKIHWLDDRPGTGSAFKMINQLLAGVHIAAACEAIAFAEAQGLDLQRVYDVITSSAGNSWMFENRIRHVLAGNYSPESAVEIFVKDLGIVGEMSRGCHQPAPLAAAALQMYLAAVGLGMGRDDDSSLARVYAKLGGLTLPQAG